MKYALDTHILVWWRLNDAHLSRAQFRVLEEIEQTGEAVGLSAISLRELARMIERGRLVVDTPLDKWFDDLESSPLIDILPLTPAIAIESVRLGDDFARDPADQIIVATARCHGLTLVTADERIRKWGKVKVI